MVGTEPVHTNGGGAPAAAGEEQRRFKLVGASNFKVRLYWACYGGGWAVKGSPSCGCAAYLLRRWWFCRRALTLLRLPSLPALQRHNPRSDRFPMHKFDHIEFWCGDATTTSGR